MKGKTSHPRLALRAAGGSLCLLTGALGLVACGHGSSSNNSSYTIGGTITGLTSGSVELVLNSSTVVTVDAGATTWTFAGSLAANSSYSVAVAVQPTSELCEVTTDASRTTLTANVTDVGVVCNTYGQWTWFSGSDDADASGLYGALGTASASSVPGARQGAASWTDSSGNLYLFGGQGYNSSGVLGSLNDLWRYNPATGEWTWVSGGSGENANGVYGTVGMAAAANVPGARYASSYWIDAAGNLYLFGGYGYGATGGSGRLNDLWEYSPSSGLWTWVSGANTANATGVYGTEGTAAAGNVPGARYAATGWIDSTGNLYLFGGTGYGATGSAGSLSDLWRYTPTSAQWTWIDGSNAIDAGGVYGTAGAGAASNLPGGRQGANGWIDSAGNLWLFGGYGYDSNNAAGYLNDLWHYSLSTAQWTWVAGAATVNAAGVYGTQGTAAAGDAPGARQGASSWIDNSGNAWLFGGYGYTATSGAGGLGALNDLWEYAAGGGQWVWVSGSNGDDASGAYGVQGAVSASTGPGGRQGASTWIDGAGHLRLFGGAGFASSGNGYLNDLWQFIPP